MLNRYHGPEKQVGHLHSKSGQGCLVGGTYLAAIETNRQSRLAESAPVQPVVQAAKKESGPRVRGTAFGGYLPFRRPSGEAIRPNWSPSPRRLSVG